MREQSGHNLTPREPGRGPTILDGLNYMARKGGPVSGLAIAGLSHRLGPDAPLEEVDKELAEEMTRLDALVVADFGNEILQELADKRKVAFHDWNGASLRLLQAMFPPLTFASGRTREAVDSDWTPWQPLPFTDIGDDQETGENDKRSMT